MNKHFKVILDSKYGEDIEAIRRYLRIKEFREGLEFFDVQILSSADSSNAKDKSKGLTVTVKSHDFYSVAFRNANARFFFPEYTGDRFQDMSYRPLSFTGSYNDLCVTSDSVFLDRPLDINTFNAAYANLVNWRESHTINTERKQYIALMIFIVSEALRFDILCCQFANLFNEQEKFSDKTFTPRYIHREFAKNWRKSTEEGDPYTEIKWKRAGAS